MIQTCKRCGVLHVLAGDVILPHGCTNYLFQPAYLRRLKDERDRRAREQHPATQAERM